MLIYKEQLQSCTGAKPLYLPYPTVKEALNNILHLDLQYGRHCLWFNADSDVENLKKYEYAVIAIGTGHNLATDYLNNKYIGTLLLDNGDLVLHYFLINMDEFEKSKRKE